MVASDDAERRDQSEAERRRAIGRQIQRARAAYQARTGEKMGQRELAERLGVSDARRVRAYESGESAPDRYIALIAEATQMPVSFFYETGPVESETPPSLDAEIERLNRRVEELARELQELRELNEGYGGGESSYG